MVEFVEEWFIEQTLGEGAFGEVKLLVHKRTKDEVALKMIDLKAHPDADETVNKEIDIHKRLSHEHIIRFYGNRQEGTLVYMFLEYASGGELFDRIEPDVGTDPSKAQLYFHQIIKGVEYLHSRDIAHRDLKPENILLDANGKIKISDFGFATLFRFKGIERLLEKRCGTLPYVAPEVLSRPYKAQPADIWSCGVILVALLAGELPWDRPAMDCRDYVSWKTGKASSSLWKKMEITTLAFVKRLLSTYASRRITMDEILRHPWMSKRLPGCNGLLENGSKLGTKVRSGILTQPAFEDSVTRLCYSQPEPCFDEDLECMTETNENGRSPVFCFSQPAARAESFFLGSQLDVDGSPSTNKTPPIQRWVKRMTRFCVSTSKDETVKHLTAVLSEFGYSWKVQLNSVPLVTVSTVDCRKMQLIFKASVIEMGNNMVLLDFRLSRGDGLEFKRHFVRVKEALSSIDLKGPVSWPMAVATNSIP